MKVAVYDMDNPRRLLGYILNPPRLRADNVRFPVVLPALKPVWNEEPLPPIFTTVDMVIKFDDEDNGYVRRAKFLTDAPLKDLLGMSNFLLPGENEEQAYRRMNW